jgi:hypothetical protein
MVEVTKEIMLDYYNKDSSFKSYVDKHCSHYDHTLDEALENALVREAYYYYLHRLPD